MTHETETDQAPSDAESVSDSEGSCDSTAMEDDDQSVHSWCSDSTQNTENRSLAKKQGKVTFREDTFQTTLDPGQDENSEPWHTVTKDKKTQPSIFKRLHHPTHDSDGSLQRPSPARKMFRAKVARSGVQTVDDQSPETSDQSVHSSSSDAESAAMPHTATQAYQCVGAKVTACNKECDVVNLAATLLDRYPNQLVMNYKKEQPSILHASALIQELSGSSSTQYFSDFLGVRDEVTRNRFGELQKPRQSAAFYILINKTFRQLKEEFINALGGFPEVQRIGWFLEPYNDTEVGQKIIAIIQGKNPKHSWGPGLAARATAVLKEKTATQFNFTSVIHNDRTSQQEKIKVIGLQCGISKAAEAERLLRKAAI